MSQRILFSIFLFAFHNLLHAQDEKQALTQEDIAAWNQIEAPLLSPDGRWISYVLQPNEGDPALMLYDTRQKKESSFKRANEARISADSRFLAFLVHPPEDSLKAQRRRKVKEENLPKDTLAIYTLA
ncbi:MAG: PD40 domain-containing protein, partial [Phaeodactylibacter sp.]|nr:PD40 domain-containing protein [Phaeodactylibacter sp.]